MVAHYTAARKRRHDDAYSPGNRRRACARTGPPSSTPTRSGRPSGTSPSSSGGWRPPCAASPTTITGRTRSGAPSSWTPRPTCSPMAWGRRATRQLAALLAAGTPAAEITAVKGTCFLTKDPSVCAFPAVDGGLLRRRVTRDKRAYAAANLVEYDEHDPIRGPGRHPAARATSSSSPIPPPCPLDHRRSWTRWPSCPTFGSPIPCTTPWGACPPLRRYASPSPTTGGALGPATSVPWPSTRGAPSPPAATRAFSGRSAALTQHPGFKGYIHDVGGPTANFRRPSCQKQLQTRPVQAPGTAWPPTPCPNLDADHTDYLAPAAEAAGDPRHQKGFHSLGDSL